MAQSIKRPTSAQVMIPRFVILSPTSGSVLTAQSPEPALNSVSPSLSGTSVKIQTERTEAVLTTLDRKGNEVLTTAVQGPEKQASPWLPDGSRDSTKLAGI